MRTSTWGFVGTIKELEAAASTPAWGMLQPPDDSGVDGEPEPTAANILGDRGLAELPKAPQPVPPAPRLATPPTTPPSPGPKPAIEAPTWPGLLLPCNTPRPASSSSSGAFPAERSTPEGDGEDRTTSGEHAGAPGAPSSPTPSRSAILSRQDLPWWERWNDTPPRSPSSPSASGDELYETALQRLHRQAFEYEEWLRQGDNDWDGFSTCQPEDRSPETSPTVRTPPVQQEPQERSPSSSGSRSTISTQRFAREAWRDWDIEGWWNREV